MQMKKRVLSAFMALCMVCSLVGAAWAVIPQQTSAANGQFTITWQNVRQTQKVDISCYDYDNEDQTLSVSPEDFTVQSGETVSFVSTNQDLQIDGYEFVEAKYQSRDQWQDLTSLKVTRESGSGKYYVDGERVYSEPTIRLYYRPTGGDSSDDGSTVTSATVTTSKTAVSKDDGSDNYDLTLSITGGRGSETNPAKLDVLFILDVSNSMGYVWDRNETRIDVAEDAIDQITSGLSSNDALDVQYALVAFGGGNSTWNNPYRDAGTEQNWTKNASAVVGAVPDVYNYGILGSSNLYGGGTNYEAGIRTGKDVLKTSRANAETVVIFITDGNPGYYYTSNGATDGDGSPSNYNGTALEHAVSELKGLNTDYFCVVGVTNSVDSKVFNDMVAAVGVPSSNKGAYTANSADDLLDIFEKIEGNITFFAASDVTITDPLSQYADLVLDANGNPQFTITVKHGEQPWTSEAGESELTFQNASGNNVTVTASYNSTTRTITLAFPEDYQLEEGYTYSVSTVITPSDAAIRAGMNSDEAKQTPDEGTGTHATNGEKGYWSNDNENAKVTYTANGEEGSTAFPKPVIQVTKPTTTELTLTKTFDGLSDAEVNYLIFDQDTSSANDDDFGWDINYCQNTTHESDEGGMTYMATDVPEGITLPDGTVVTGGGDFRITAQQFLTVGDNGIDNISDITDNSYQNEDTGATLSKNQDGNWTYSVTLTVPVTDGSHFYTVFEQHQEVPGYAKINDSNAEWTMTRQGMNTTEGTGKFMDESHNNIYESMTEINSNNKTYQGTTYSEMEDVCIAAGAFQKIKITSPTTIAYTNHYTGKLDVTKEIGSTNEYNDAKTANYTLTLAPANAEKQTVNGGLSGKVVHYYTVDQDSQMKTATLTADGSFTVTIQPDETIHFIDLPAIQWKVTEGDAKVNGYKLNTVITDDNKKVVSDKSHWNGYGDSDIIGATNTDDGIASVDSAVRGNTNPVVVADSVALVTVTNSYTNSTLTISKTVGGNMGDTTKDFTFTLKILNSKDGQPLNAEEYGVIAQTAVKTSLNQDETFNLSFNDAGEAKFTLHSGQELQINIPEGYYCVVSEKNDGYTTTISAPNTDGNVWTMDADKVTVSGTIVMNTEVQYTNNLNLDTPPSGFFEDNLPFTLMISAAGLAGIALIATILVRRQRRRRE